jgi:hypothetical protein
VLSVSSRLDECYPFSSEAADDFTSSGEPLTGSWTDLGDPERHFRSYCADLPVWFEVPVEESSWSRLKLHYR